MTKAPQMKGGKKATIDGGSAFRLSKKPSPMGEFFNEAICLFPKLVEMNREHNDRPKQIKKRRVKLKWLIITIPREGAKEAARLKVNKK